MRRILYIAYFFPPLGGAGVQRSLKFVRYLPEHGWQPTVLTGATDYWLRDEALVQELDPSIEVHRVAAWGARFLGAKARKHAAPRSAARIGLLRKLARWVFVPDAYLGWTWPARSRAVSMAEQQAAEQRPFDVVLTTSSPDSAHLIGRALHRRLGIPWVADLRDPWVRRLSYSAPTPLHHAWQQRLERQCLEEAGAVLVTSETTREDYLRRLPALDPKRVHVLTNGYDDADFAEALELLDQEPGPGTGWPSDVLHAGQLNPDRPIGPFLDGLRRFVESGGGRTPPATRSPHSGDGSQASDSLEMLFLGGHYDRDVREVSDRGLASHVTFRDNVSHAASIASLLRARVLLLLEQNSDRGRLILPGKIFEYVRSQRPVLALVPRDGAADRLVRSLDAGCVVDPSNPGAIAEALERLLRRSPPDPRSTPPAAVQTFDRRGLTAQLAGHLQGLFHEGR